MHFELVNDKILQENKQNEDMRQKYSKMATKWHLHDQNISTVKLLYVIQMAWFLA